MPGTIEHIILPEQDGLKLKTVVLRDLKVSNSCFSSMKFSGGVTLDGAQAFANDRVAAGQRLRLTLPQGEETATEAYPIPLSVPYMDDDYCVIDKPAPLPTMPSALQEGPALENAFYAYLGCPELYTFRPVNRLDKGTSGLMCVAMNAHAQQLLQKQLHTDAFVREYTALCDGVMGEDAGLIDAPIGLSGNGIKRAVMPDGKPSRTRFTVLARGKHRTLLNLRLETGRTHQIRVHMAYLGMPVTGDYLYGTEHILLPGRFALHSSYIRFVSPLTGQTIEANSPVPECWYDLLNE